MIAGVFYPTSRWACVEYREREGTSNKMLRSRHRAPGLRGERFQCKTSSTSTTLSIRCRIATFCDRIFLIIIMLSTYILRMTGSSGRAVCRQQGGVAVGHNSGSSGERSNGCPGRCGDAGREGGERFVRERHFREWGGHGICGVDEERDGSDCPSRQERDQRRPKQLASTFFPFLFGRRVEISDRPLQFSHSFVTIYQVTNLCTINK